MSEHGIGHNSGESDKGLSAQRLKAYVERIERVTVDIENAQNDRKEIYAETKSSGFDPKIIKKLIRLRKMDASDRLEEESLLQVYADAVGM